MTSSITPLWNQMTKKSYCLCMLISFFLLTIEVHAQAKKPATSATPLVAKKQTASTQEVNTDNQLLIQNDLSIENSSNNKKRSQNSVLKNDVDFIAETPKKTQTPLKNN